MRDPAILQQIFQEALHRTGDERAAYLNATCAGDPELLEEVESLLATATATETLTGEGAGGSPSPFALPDLGGGRYEIQRLIGRGGMGQVYLARDRQLDRVVAIKAIRPSLASKPEFVHRLATEARLAASVDHPFICKVHELIQRDDGQVFFVMEYVEGQTLRTILKKGPLDLLTAVRLARELAEALRFAHERGLVHRDIKPGNVMVTSHGHVKVMDFGIAKTDRPEEPAAATRPGQILGTPAYMSPEQAAGRPVDHRSDIFSFGMVFYECLTGDLPFESLSTTEYRHQAAVAPPRPLPKRVPQRVRKLVARCLEKTPEKRYASLEPVQAELGTVLSVLSATHLSLWQRIRLAPRPWLVAGLLVAIAGVATIFVVNRIRADRPSQLLTQQPVVTWPSVEESSRVSPDGTTVAFVSNQGGPRLWIRLLDGNEPKPITAVRDAIKTPAWSPDGKQLAYLFRNEGRAWLQIISVWGELAGTARPLGGGWDDVALVRWIGQRIYFSVASGTQSVLWRHDITRGVDEQVTHSSGKRFTTSAATVNVDVRQDEARIVFVAERPDEGLWLADLDGRNAERLPMPPGSMLTPRWKGSDGKRILYVTIENGQPDIWEYRLDTGRKAAVTTSPLEEETIDMSSSGDLVVADTVEQIAHLWAVDPAGSASSVQLTNDSRSDLWPSLSQTGRLIFHRRKGSFVTYSTRDTELVDARWTDFRLVPGAVIGSGAAGGVSADGRRVFYLRWTDNPADFPELWVKDLDSPNQPVKLWNQFWFPGNHVNTWAPMGQNAVWGPRGSDELYFVRPGPSTDPTFEIVRATLDANLKATMHVLAAAHGEQRFPDLAVSDDGSFLAVVRTNRRLYRGGTVELLDLGRPEAPPNVVFEGAEGTQLYVKGWTRRGTIVALRAFRPDVKNATEIWEIDPRGKRRLIAVEAGLLGMTAVLDPVRDRLFGTSVTNDLSTVRSVSIVTGTSKTVVANALEGITFGGYAVTNDGWLLYMRKDTNHDVWAFSLSDHQAASPSQGAKR
jgi:serine/threonine protein kinase